MTVLTVNTGSSSVRVAAFAQGGESQSQFASAHFSGKRNEPVAMLHTFLWGHSIKAVAAVAHRIVEALV